MKKVMQCWLVGGALLSAAMMGCRGGASGGCASCGHGPIASTPSNTIYQSAQTPTTPAATTNASNVSPVGMPMPSSGGVRVIDSTTTR